MNISKDVKTIRKELFAHIESVQDDYISKGWLPARMNLNNGIIRGLLEIFIWGIWQLYQFLQFVMLQATPNKATGGWLDMHGNTVDVARKGGTKATGNIKFARKTGNNSNIKIASGKIVRTPADAEGRRYRYTVTEETILPAGQDSVLVPVIAEDYGSKANATAGLIRELVTPVDGIASVNNEADWLISEGADEETDAQLFERYRLQWAAQAGVTSAAYASAALSVPGVAAVKIFDQHPRGQGTIDVVILGAGGAPTQTLLDAVTQAIQDAIIINDDVLVKGVELFPVPLKLTIEYYSGKAEDLKATAEAYIRRRAETVSQTIGADVILGRLVLDVLAMANIKRVVWESPATDTTVESDRIFQLAGLDITMRQVNDE